MINTCRCTINPTSFRNRVGFIASILGDFRDTEMFSSGSSAELYIRPMLLCYGDVDIMNCFKTILAIPYGSTPPLELWDCRQDTVTVCEIIDSHKPGYVYLQQSYVLEKNDNGLYVVQKVRNECTSFLEYTSNILPPAYEAYLLVVRLCNEEICNEHVISKVHSMFTPVDSHGPAKRLISKNFSFYLDFLSEIDYVVCVLCPVWPQQAALWPIRNRHHDWPDQETINLVVSGACHVVGTVHPSCRDDQWMSKHQWRLSFSRAEITLLNSWTPVQQIVYHMLRIFMKREIFSKTNENDKLKFSNYHIKTAMLWACEQNPQTWWSEESSLVKLCSGLLQRLTDCVAEKQCQHYFISNCNLLDSFAEDDSWMIYNNLRNFANESMLLSWFFENYIRECAQVADIPALFEHYCSIDEVQRIVNAIIDWKLNTLPRDLYEEYVDLEINMLLLNLVYRRDAKTTLIIMKALQNCDPVVRDYSSALISLRVAFTMEIQSMTADLLEVLWTIFFACSLESFDSAVSRLESAKQLSIRKAIKLATLSNVRRNALDVLYDEMAKAYLHQSLTCK